MIGRFAFVIAAIVAVAASLGSGARGRLTLPPPAATPVPAAPSPGVVEGREGLRQSGYVVDAKQSTIVVVLHRAGLLRFLGHEHGILVNDWTADIVYSPDDPQRASVELTVQVGGLVIDSEEARRLARVDPDGPTDEEVAEIRAAMLGAELLDAERFPTIDFRTQRVRSPGEDRLHLQGPLTIRDVSRPLQVTARLTPEGDGIRVSGELEIRQSDFGIEPVSIGGLVKVADRLDVRFDVLVRPLTPSPGDDALAAPLEHRHQKEDQYCLYEQQGRRSRLGGS